MANLLTITKLDNDFFSFVLNGDVANEVKNIWNYLTISAGKCHFKTSNGANIIKEQDIVFGNVTLIDGVTTIVPTSDDNLIDELTALGFFDWRNNGSGGVDRFTDLLDTFSFTNQGGKMVIVNNAETQLTAIPISNANNSTDLLDMPSTISPNNLLIGKNDGTEYLSIDPLDLPISTATANAISIISPLPITNFDYPPLEEDGIQTFEVPAGRTVKAMYINGAFQMPSTDNNTDRIDTFSQSGTTITLNQPTYTGNYISGFYQ